MPRAIESKRKIPLESRLLEVEERLARLEGHLSQEGATANASRLEQLEAQLRQVTDASSREQQRVGELATLVETLATQTEEVGTQLAEVEIGALAEHVEALAQTLNERRQQHEDALARLQNQQMALNEFGERLIQCEQRPSDAQSDLQPEAIEGISSRIAQFEAESHDAVGRLERVEHSLSELGGRLHESTERIGSMDFGQLAQRLEEISSRTAQLEATTGQSHTNMEELRHHLSEWSTSVDQRLHTLRNQELTAISDSVQQLAARLGELEPLRDQTHGQGSALDQLRLRLEALESREQVDPNNLVSKETFAPLVDRVGRLEPLRDQLLDQTGMLENLHSRMERFDPDTLLTEENLAPLVRRLEQVEHRADERDADASRQEDSRQPTTGLGVWAACLVGLLLGGASLTLSLWPKPVITARRIVLHDADGIPRGEWVGEPTGTTLSLRDPQGGDLIGLEVSPEGAALKLQDEGGAIGFSVSPELALLSMRNGEGAQAVSLEVDPSETRMHLATAEKGQAITMLADKSGSALVLTDRKQAPRLMLLAHDSDDGVRVFDQDRRLRAGLGVSQDGPALNMWDESGQRRVVLSSNDTGPALGFWSTDDKPRLMLGVSDSATSLLNLYDAKGTRRILLDVASETATARFYDTSGEPLLTIPEARP